MLEFIVLGQIPGLHYTITFTAILFIVLGACGGCFYQTLKKKYHSLKKEKTRQLIYYISLR